MRRPRAARKIPDWLLRLMAAGSRCWDRCYTHYMGLDCPQAQIPPALRIEIITYTGKMVLLEGGRRVNNGDRIVVLHLHNSVTSKLGSLEVVNAFRASLRELALRIGQEPRFSGVKACVTDTIFWNIRGLGFEARPLSPLKEFRVRWGSRLLLVGFCRDGLARIDRYWGLDEARRIWISVPMLKKRHSAKAIFL